MLFVETFSHLLPKQMRYRSLVNAWIWQLPFFSRCVWSPGVPWSLFSSKSLRFHQSAWCWNWSYLSTWPLVHPLDSSWKRPKKNRWIGDVRCENVEMKAVFGGFLRMLRPWVLGKGWIDIKVSSQMDLDFVPVKIGTCRKTACRCVQNDPYPDNQGFFWVNLSAIKAIPSAFRWLILTRWLQTQCFSTCM